MRNALLGMFVMALAIAPAYGAAEKGGDAGGASAGNELVFGAAALPNGQPANNAGTVLIGGGNFIAAGFSLQYNRGLGGGLQAGLKGNFAIVPGAALSPTSGNVWTAMAALTWNMDEKVNDSIFVSLGAGVGTLGGGGFIQVLADANIGKRFEIMHGLNYRPSVGIMHNFTSTAAATANPFYVNINFLQFSYVW